MAPINDELERALAAMRIAPDYAPARYHDQYWAATSAILAGASSAVVPWAGFNDRSWWTPPGRDRFALMLDFTRVTNEFTRLYRLPNLHPGQEQLFDPDTIHG
jgi:hypothetical protein